MIDPELIAAAEEFNKRCNKEGMVFLMPLPFFARARELGMTEELAGHWAVSIFLPAYS